jgi:hypothetical protein
MKQQTLKAILIVLYIVWIVNSIYLIYLMNNFEQHNYQNKQQEKFPNEKEFLEIYNKPYIYGTYDCSNKAAEYYRGLISKNYNAKIWVIEGDATSNHAIVVVNYNNLTYYLDPTYNIWTTNDWYYKGKLIREVNKEELNSSNEWK